MSDERETYGDACNKDIANMMLVWTTHWNAGNGLHADVVHLEACSPECSRDLLDKYLAEQASAQEDVR